MQGFKSLITLLSIFILGYSISYGEYEKSEERERIRAGTEWNGEKAKEILVVSTDYTTQQKAEYERQIEDKLREFDKIDRELSSRAAGLSDKDRVVFNMKRDEFMLRKKAAYEKLKDLKTASVKSWMQIKTELDGSIAYLATFYDKEFSQYR
ncbi:MAG: hypothetical protein E3K32_01660 [wastewater metagenome]|nr:hypothetical protein [Candidatus Loosdrechtia aerotolerans]